MTLSTDSTANTPRVLLIDGHSLAFRAFYGYPAESFSTSTGQYTNAVYGFMTLLMGVVRSEQPTHIGVAFDKSRITFRTAEYPQYKATRAKTPDEFIGQVGLIQDVLDALNIAQVEMDDYEGDDIIATWVTQALRSDMDVSISSGDRDSFQLVNDHVTVLYPSRGDIQRMTPSAIEEKYGVPPQRYPELAALVGETSDNLPGVPGVGPKTAAKWITQYDGLENLIRRADQVPGKAGESLRDHLDDVRRNRQLNALVCDLDLSVPVSGLIRQAPDMKAVYALFDTLEFRSLRDKVREVFDTVAMDDEPVHDEPVPEARVLTTGQIAPWLMDHVTDLCGVYIDGTWSHGAWDLSSISIAAEDSTVWIDSSRLDSTDEQALVAWLEDESIPKAVHDAKEPMIALWEHGWDIDGVTCDTQLGAYLANPDRRAFTLGDLAERYLNRPIGATDSSGTDQPAFDFDSTPTAQRDGDSAAIILRLVPPLEKEVEAHGAASLLTDVELPLQRVLGRMEMTGIAVDQELLDTLWRQFDDRVREAEQAAYAQIGHEINLSSPKQLQTVLFDELNMPKTRKRKSGYTTDAEALEWLYSVTSHPFLEHLLAHRDAIKLRQTVEGLVKSVADDGRIHTTYLQTAAATGRLSSQDPNLQNIPTRTPAGNQIRQVFVAGHGFESLMTADYSQVEMRIMADVSGDQGLIDAFRSGQDFHTVMAARVFHVDPSEVTPAERSRVKAVNYGLAYGLSAYGLSSQLKIPVGDATKLMEEYFEQFGGVRDYLNSLVAEARKTGYTQTILGRRRYLPDLTSLNRTRREMAERMALNAPIQGTAADIIKLAMLKVSQRLADGFQSRMLLQVHDELVFEVAAGEKDKLEQMVREEMGGAVALAVPLDVSVGVGSNWASAAH